MIFFCPAVNFSRSNLYELQPEFYFMIHSCIHEYINQPACNQNNISQFDWPITTKSGMSLANNFNPTKFTLPKRYRADAELVYTAEYRLKLKP